MKQLSIRTLALAAMGCLAACGNREIELRRTPAAIGEPAPAPVDAADLARDGVPLPSSNLPGDADVSSPADPGSTAPVSASPSSSEQLPLPAAFDKGCRKLDLLFVIDNSDSMEDEQLPGGLEPVERLEGHLPRQIPADPEDHERVGRSRALRRWGG